MFVEFPLAKNWITAIHTTGTLKQEIKKRFPVFLRPFLTFWKIASIIPCKGKFPQITVIFALRGVVGSRGRNAAVALAKSPLAALKVLREAHSWWKRAASSPWRLPHSFPLLILDDFGMERGTEYGLEQVYNVIDSRYRSRKPLIVTTNLTLEELQNPEDTPHARIYDRLIEMCSPVCITGENFRKAKAREKMEQLKTLLNRKESLWKKSHLWKE